MLKKLLLIAVVIACSLAVSGQRVKRQPARYVLTGCRPAPEPQKICGYFQPRSPDSSYHPKPTPCNPYNMGVYISGRALKPPVLPLPSDFSEKRPAGIFVDVSVDEKGNVISASATSGHPLLRELALAAARKAKFRPVILFGERVKIKGLLIYHFVEPPKRKSKKSRSS